MRKLLAATMLASTTLATAAAAAVPTLVLAAGEGRLTGAAVRGTTRPSTAGRAYATGFAKAGDTAAFRFPAAAGVYDVRLRYRSPGGHKGVSVIVNGTTSDVMFPQTGDDWSTFDAGRVEMSAGTNDLSVGGGWGHYDLDAVELVPTSIAIPPKPTGSLCDPRATPASHELMRRLLSGYGATTWAGGYGDREQAYVAAHAGGRVPAIFGVDLMDFSPSRVERGTDPSAIVNDALRHHVAGQAVTVSWHWNAPAGLLDRVDHVGGKPVDRRWYKGFNADATTFDVAAALRDPTSPQYALLLRDIDAIAVPLRQLADAGVPVLWRPLHEAEGGWFWWGAHGPGPSVALWRLLHDRLTDHHGLHNLIWVYSATILGDPRWYPGDDVVDVVGVDAYPSDNRDALSQMWLHWSAVAAGKPLAVTEFGGVPDVGRMFRLGCPWLYFVSWNEPNGPATTGAAEVGRRYAEGHVGDLAAWRRSADHAGR